MLAGMLQSPSLRRPGQQPDGAKARWNYVLDGMVSTKHLDAATRADLRFPATQPITTGNGLGATGPTALIVQQVKAELRPTASARTRSTPAAWSIKTTIDPTAQAAAVNAIDTTFAKLTAKQRNIKNALVAVNPASGAVLAYYGGPKARQ